MSWEAAPSLCTLPAPPQWGPPLTTPGVSRVCLQPIFPPALPTWPPGRPAVNLISAVSPEPGALWTPGEACGVSELIDLMVDRRGQIQEGNRTQWWLCAPQPSPGTEEAGWRKSFTRPGVGGWGGDGGGAPRTTDRVRRGLVTRPLCKTGKAGPKLQRGPSGKAGHGAWQPMLLLRRWQPGLRRDSDTWREAVTAASGDRPQAHHLGHRLPLASAGAPQCTQGAGTSGG